MGGARTWHASRVEPIVHRCVGMYWSIHTCIILFSVLLHLELETGEEEEKVYIVPQAGNAQSLCELFVLGVSLV